MQRGLRGHDTYDFELEYLSTLLSIRNDPTNALRAISIADGQSLASGQIKNLCAVNPAPVLTVKIKSPTSEHRQFSIADTFYPVHIPRPGKKTLLKQRYYHGPAQLIPSG